ncbi:MAG: DUF2339 domain-containing protein [Ignavibacteriota bacterium]
MADFWCRCSFPPAATTIPALFTYIGLLDLGVLGLVVVRSWRWIGSLAYIGTQFLFWGWYSEHYHPEKRFAALLFQTAIFVIFAAADLAPNLRRRARRRRGVSTVGGQPLPLLRHLLRTPQRRPSRMDGYRRASSGGRLYRARPRATPPVPRRPRPRCWLRLGTALTFVTLAIPIQLDSNWITIAWGLEGLIMLWAALRLARPRCASSRQWCSRWRWDGSSFSIRRG